VIANPYAVCDSEHFTDRQIARPTAPARRGVVVSLARRLAVVLVALLLTTTLVTANVVAAAHLTVLDPAFVTTSMEEEGGYAFVETAVEDAALGAAPASATGPVNTSELLADAVSEEYVAAQTDANVERAYAYLHGDSETLNLSIATGPIRENLSAGVERELRNASLADLLRQSDAELDGPINASTLERLTANESGYEATKAEFRETVRERVLDEAVDRGFERASNDELLGLVVEDYDPRDYTEAEKERMVAEREPEIRVALRDYIERERGDDIDDAVEDQIVIVREQGTTDPAEAETELEAATASIQNSVVHGLTTNESYQSFQSNLSEDRAELAAVAAAEADARLASEMPDRVDLTENVSGAGEQGFEQARTGVQWLDRLAFVLPVVGLSLVGLLYALRRSVAAVASDTGLSLLAAGVPTVVGVELARSRLQSMATDAPAEQQQAMDVLVGIAGRVIGTVGDVAIVLSVAGVVLVAGSLAVRYGAVDVLREKLGDGSDDRGML